MADDESGGKRLVDWTHAFEEPEFVQDAVLIVNGLAPTPMDITFEPEPIGIREEEYRPIGVYGTPAPEGLEVETPWNASLPDANQYAGGVGYVLVGAKKRQYFPPRKDS